MSLGIETVAAKLLADPVLGHWREQIQSAAASLTPLMIRGGGSKFFYGRPIEGELLDTRRYRGIVDYEPTELVITARCGTPLAEIESALDQQGQMLAFEPPRFADSATIGGVVATGLSGPRRMAAGAVRDFVLGVTLMDGNGRLLSFGGQVMKNVAGYDVSRLLVGSLGCLGLLTEVSLKVVPKARSEKTLRFELTEAEALDRLCRWAGQPLPISATAWFNGVLHLRLSGAESAVAAATCKLGGEAVAEETAISFWTGLRDQTHPFFSAGDKALVRLSLPDTAPALPLPGPQLVEWTGAQRWCQAEVEQFREINGMAKAEGGHASLYRVSGDRRTSDFLSPLPKPLQRIHRALKKSFDPAGIFNRGRMYPEF